MSEKMKIRFFLLLILFSNHSIAQIVNYLEYYNKINQAELLINRYDFDSASAVYETTFNSYPNHFYKDLHNVCLCYIRTNKLDKAKLIAEELVLHGYELNDFEKDSAFTPLVKSMSWNTLRTNYIALRTKYLEGLNPTFRKKIYEMFLKDQSVALSKKMCFQDSMFYYQAMELEKLFLQYGFPGSMINKDTLNTKIHILIRHYFGLVNRATSNPEMLKESCYRSIDFSKINLKQVINNGLSKGLIPPQTYVGMVSHWDKSNPYGELCVKVDYEHEKVALYLNLSQEKIVEVNSNRVKIGLPEISFTNPDVLNSTWYSKYPFSEIKKAILACEHCTRKQDT